MHFSLCKVIIILFAIELVLSDPENVQEKVKLKTVKKTKKHKSTSSSDSRTGSSSAGDSLDMSTSSLSSTSSKEIRSNEKNAYRPRSSAERSGWKKWRRKCTPCPEVMRKKWRDPSIQWICGAYQRARRSFKDSCMMRYRNCQDGTMFIKIHEGRCKNDTKKDPRKHGEHFFYDYKAKLSDDSTSSNSKSSSSSSSDEAWKKNWHLNYDDY